MREGYRLSLDGIYQPDYGEVHWGDIRGEYPPSPNNGTPNTSTGVSSGVAKQLLTLDAVESPVKQQDRVFSLVSVSFTRDASDVNFAGVNIWAKGYKGNAQAVLVTSGQDSPVNFLMETTGESVTFIGQAVSADGTPVALEEAPSAVAVLDGVTSPPPAPTISQSLVGINNGLQFAFNFLNGLVGDVIDGYWVYRNTTNDASTATRFKYIKHPPINSGAYTFQDTSAMAGEIYYYWVSAVNTSQLESSKTAAQSSATKAAPSNPSEANYVWSDRTPLASNDVGGGKANIVVDANTATWIDKTANYSGATLTQDDVGVDIPNNTVFYVYTDDINRTGGTAWKATTDFTKLSQYAGRLFLDSIRTATGGGAPTGGSGDGGGGAGGGFKELP